MTFLRRPAGPVVAELIALVEELTEALSQPPVLFALFLLTALMVVRLVVHAGG
jgi:hypothetical protein